MKGREVEIIAILEEGELFMPFNFGRVARRELQQMKGRVKRGGKEEVGRGVGGRKEVGGGF